MGSGARCGVPRTMYNLEHFGLRDTIEAGRAIRALGQSAETMEEAARDIVDFLYKKFCVEGGTGSEFALLRCFKTHRLTELPDDLQAVAVKSMGAMDIAPELRCLTLLASRGELPEWNGRHHSQGHRAIPLPSVDMVRRAPMIARLVVQMGLEIEDIVRPEPSLLVDLHRKTFNVFHIEEAVGSEFVPAQHAFVIPYKVRSVLGFGGLLPSGELFAIVMFSKVRIPRETAELFRTLALAVKLVLIPFTGKQVFALQRAVE